jgi:hypothetical protein
MMKAMAKTDKYFTDRSEFLASRTEIAISAARTTDGEGPARPTKHMIEQKQIKLDTRLDRLNKRHMKKAITVTIVKLKPDAAKTCESPTSL